MKSNEIQIRTNTLSKACIKVAALLPGNLAIVNYCRGELVKHGSDLSIQARGLTTGQISSIFVDRLSKAVDASNGCAFWLQFVIDEKLLDSTIIQPLVEESEQLTQLFMAAMRSTKIKSE